MSTLNSNIICNSDVSFEWEDTPFSIFEEIEFPTTSFVDVKTIVVKEKFVKNEAPTVNCTPLSTCNFREESEEESSVFVEYG